MSPELAEAHAFASALQSPPEGGVLEVTGREEEQLLVGHDVLVVALASPERRMPRNLIKVFRCLRSG